jgi:hypothetical protein
MTSVTDPLRTAELAVELEGVSFRVSHEAMHPPFSYRETGMVARPTPLMTASSRRAVCRACCR